MSTFVLVHGAWHGSWCWKRVRRALEVQGHQVFTPTLTGVGERSHLLSQQVDLETHIADVVNLMRWEELSDVVLCGHSSGGAVISGAADRVADRIGALVYLDAFVLANGECLYDHVPVEQRTVQGGDWRVPPIPAEVFNVNPADAPWVNRQCTPQPLATFEQHLALTGAIDGIKNVTYIQAAGFSGGPFAPFYEQAKAKGWRTFSLPCGHDVMLDLPDDLTQILIDVSARRAASA